MFGEKQSVTYEAGNFNSRNNNVEISGINMEKAKTILENIRQGKGNILLQVFTLNELLFKNNLKYSLVGTNMIEIQRLVDTKVPKIDNPKIFFDSCKKVA